MKKVLCVDTEKVYESAIEAEKATNVRRESICKACKKKVKSAGGYYWVYLDDAKKFEDTYNRKISMDDFGGKSKNIAVYCVELERKFDSAKIAAEELGLYATNIARACKGRLKTSGKYHWRYVGGSK